MRVLFDHNVPHKLRQSLPGHEVSTADEMGWATLENGELLKAAGDADFEVMLTGDKNLSFQQNLQGRRLALVILSTNNWNIIKHNPQLVAHAIAEATPGAFHLVTFHPPPRPRRSYPKP